MIPFEQIEGLPEYQSATPEQKLSVQNEYAKDFWTEVYQDQEFQAAPEEERNQLISTFDQRFGPDVRGFVEEQIEGSRRGFLANMFALVKSGGKATLAASRIADDMASGEIDANTASILAESILAEQKKFTPEELKEFQEEITAPSEDWEKAEDLSGKAKAAWDTIKALAYQVAFNPKGLAYMTAEQTANIVPGMVGMVGGAKAGGAAGSVIPGVGTAAGATIGGVVGGFMGQWGIEAGSEFRGMVAQELQKRGLEPTEENVLAILADDAFIEESVDNARDKATATSAVSAAMNVMTGKIASSAFKSAQQQAVSRLGADATADEISLATKEILASRDMGEKIATGAKAYGTQVAEEPISEAAGQYAGYGKVDIGEVAMETAGGIGGSVMETPAAIKAFADKGAGAPAAQPTPAPAPQPEVTIPASILESESLDDAIVAFRNSLQINTAEGATTFQSTPPPSTAQGAAQVFEEAGPSEQEARMAGLEEAFAFEPEGRPSTAAEAAEVLAAAPETELKTQLAREEEAQQFPGAQYAMAPETKTQRREAAEEAFLEAPPEFARSTGAPFSSEKALRTSAKQRGVDLSRYEVIERQGGFVAIPQAAKEKSATGDYFEPTTNSQAMEVSKILPINKEISPQKISSARSLIDKAKEGTGLKRKPLKAIMREDGTVRVVDGNTTLRELVARGEKYAEVELVPKVLQGESVSHSMDTLYQHAKEAVGEINKQATTFAEETNGRVKLRPFDDGLKKRETADLKLKNKYGGRVSMVDDIVAVTVVYPDYASLKAAFTKIKDRDDVMSWKNRYGQEDVSGYQDIQLTMRATNGHIYELQLNTEQMMEAKKKLHSLYKVIGHLTNDNFDKDIKTATLHMLNKLMDSGYAAAASSARGEGGQSTEDFRAGLSALADDSARILSFVTGSTISNRLSPSTRNTLLDFVSRTNVSLPESKKTSIPTSSVNVSQPVRTITEQGEEVNDNVEGGFNAEEIGAPTGERGAAEGAVGRGPGQVRVRDDAKAGVETQEGGRREEVVEVVGQKTEEKIAPKTEQFAKNKIFTADRVRKARENLKEGRGRLSAGVDPELLGSVITIGGAYFEQGVRDFADWSAKVIGEIGEHYGKYLKEGFEVVRNHPAFAKEKADLGFFDWEPPTTSDGKIKGAPPNVNSKEDLDNMRMKIVRLLKEGEVGRFWYENSANAVLKSMNGDVAKAEKFIQLIAIYSPQAHVQANTVFAVKAWNQFVNNVPREQFKVKTADQDGKAVDVLYDNKPFDGRKTNSFYINLVSQIIHNDPTAIAKMDLDSSTVALLKEKATIDMWMKRAFGYDDIVVRDDKGTGQYSFMENEILRVTDRLNASLKRGDKKWIPFQVQAAVWTAMKARYEDAVVKTKTWSESVKKGYSFIGDNGRPEFKKDAESLKQHRKIWHRQAMLLPARKARENAELTAADFSTFINRATSTITWEAIPSSSFEYDIFNASPAVKRMFTSEARGLLLSNDGADMLAQRLGVSISFVSDGAGAYGGNVNPNSLSHVVLAKEGGEFVRDNARDYALAIQYIFKQDAVPWFRTDAAMLSKVNQDKQKFRVVNERGTTISRHNSLAEAQAAAAKRGESFSVKGGKYARGVVVEFSENITENLENKVLAALGEGAGFTRISNNQIAIINFRDDSTGVPFVDDETFMGGVQSFLDNHGADLGVAEAKSMWAEGEYGYVHNWSEDGNGETILDKGSIGERSDLQRWLRDRRSDFESLIQQYSGENLKLREQEVKEFEKLGGIKFQAIEVSIPLDSDGNMNLVHWSPVPGMKTIDPDRYGEGISGAEAKRQHADPDNWVNRTYYGIGGGGYRKEVGLGQYRYEAKVPPSKMYDFAKDPEGLRAKAQAARTQNPFINATNLYEKFIKDAGYLGYWSDMNGGKVAAIFGKITPTRETLQPEAGVKLQAGLGKLSSGLPRTVFDSLLSSLSPGQRSVASKLVSSGKVVLMTTDEAIAEAKEAGYSKAELDANLVPIGIEIPGKTILVPENIPSGELWGSLRHAIGTHIGRMMANSAEFQMMKKTIDRRRGEKSDTGDAIRRAIEQIPTGTAKEDFSEEILAYMVSTSEDVGIVRRIIAMIKSMVTRFGVSYKIFNEKDFKALADLAIRREARSDKPTMFDIEGIKFQMAGRESLTTGINMRDAKIFLRDKGVQLSNVEPDDYLKLAVSHGYLKDEGKQLSLMEKAQAMKEGGADRKSIWDETGWWEMVPGEWQYEIDDSTGKWDARTWGMMKPNAAVPLPEVYNNPPLFKAYPYLKEVRVIAAKLDQGHLGGWDQEGNIRINITLFDPAARTVLEHEMQHVIQDIENFSKGGNVANQIKKNQDKLTQLDRQIASINEQMSWIAANGPQYQGQLVPEARKLYDSLMESRSVLGAEWVVLSGNINSISHNEYKRLTGEVQARLTQARLGMSKADRKKHPPWETLEGMLMGEGLMGMNQKPEDILISRKDATSAGWADSYTPTPAVGSVHPAVTFLDRMANTVDFKGKFDEIATYFWNRDKAIERVQESIGPQPIERDHATLKGLVGKIMANDVKQFDKNVLQPFLDFLAKHKISIQDVEELAHAQHAPERNLQMRRVNARRYVDNLLIFMTDAEKRPWQDKLGLIQDEFVMNDQTRNKRRDNTIALVEEMADTVRSQRAQVDQLAKEFAARVFTAEEIKKGTPEFLQNRLLNMYERLEKRESIIAHWDDVKGRLSGMTNGQARAIEDRFQGRADVYQAAEMMRSISRAALDINHEAGELTDDEYSAIVSTYQYHIPLMREESDEGKTPTGKAGVGPLGKPVKIAYGSTNGVAHILSHVVDRYQSALTRRRKLEAGRALYEMVKQNPDEGLWSIGELEKAPYLDNEGNVRFYPDQQLDPKYQTYVKVDGVKHIIEVAKDNPMAVRFMEAINRQVTPLGPIIRASGHVTRILARLSTTWTPEFTLPNFIRDLQTAMVNMSSTEAAGMQSKVFGNIRSAVAGIYREERGKPSGQWGAIYRDAAENGVIMGWMRSYDDVAQLSEKIQSDLEMKNGGHKIKENFMRLGNFIESINLSVENGVRVATYQALVESGIDKRNAARIASNLTVDFTKHGTAGPAMNSLWMFANAGIQGNVRILQAVGSSSTVRKTVVGIAAFGAFASFLGAIAGGDDDDGDSYYDKLKRSNPALFERNIVLMVPGGEGKHIKIPMAYGYNIFFKFGEEIGSVMRGQKPVEAAIRWGKAFINNFNPLAAGTILQTVAPTLLDPLAQVRENAAWHGGPLMPAGNPWANQPDSELYFKDVNPASKAVTEWLNRHTGGSKYREGAISVSPETIEMLVETFTGGAGKMAKDVLNLPFAVAEGDLSIRNVPIARRLIGTMPTGINRQIYFENREEMSTFVRELKSATKDDRPGLIREPLYKMVGAFERTEERIRDLNKQKKEIVSKKGNTDRIDKLIESAQVEFNKRYNKTLGND